MNEQESVADSENTDEKDYLYLDDVLRNTKDIGYYLGYNPTISEKTHWFELLKRVAGLSRDFHNGKQRKNTAQNLSSQYAKSKATLKSEQDIHRQTLNTLRDFLNGEVSRISYTIDGLRDGRYAQIKDELEGIISGIGTDSFPNPDEFVTETLDAIRLLTRYKEKFSYNESNYQLFNLRRKRHGEHYLEVGLQSRVKATIVRL